MLDNRKEEIIMATLRLASEKGLGVVSMNMIAESVGIKKPSLYNHFKSKDELIDSMYQYLRERAKEKTNVEINFSVFESMPINDILKTMVNNYITMNNESNVKMFYKVMYSERAISKVAAKIILSETERMINATKEIFLICEEKKLLKFEDVQLSATSFALTIHGFMDYAYDKEFCMSETPDKTKLLINRYIDIFCNEHEIKGR